MGGAPLSVTVTRNRMLEEKCPFQSRPASQVMVLLRPAVTPAP